MDSLDQRIGCVQSTAMHSQATTSKLITITKKRDSLLIARTFRAWTRNRIYDKASQAKMMQMRPQQHG